MALSQVGPPNSFHDQSNVLDMYVEQQRYLSKRRTASSQPPNLAYVIVSETCLGMFGATLSCAMDKHIRAILNRKTPAKMLGVYAAEVPFPARVYGEVRGCRRLPMRHDAHKAMRCGPAIFVHHDIPVALASSAKRPRKAVATGEPHMRVEPCSTFAPKSSTLSQRGTVEFVSTVMSRAKAKAVMLLAAAFDRTYTIFLSHLNLLERFGLVRARQRAETPAGLAFSTLRRAVLQ